jgi:hypothetical protein
VSKALHFPLRLRRPCAAQLVEPDRTQVTAQLAGSGKPSIATEIVPGATEFAASIATAPLAQQPQLRRLLEWARELEQSGLAALYTSIGKGRWVLNPRLPGQARAMVTIWNDNKAAYLSPYRTVLAEQAPEALCIARCEGTRRDRPGQLHQGHLRRRITQPAPSGLPRGAKRANLTSTNILWHFDVSRTRCTPRTATKRRTVAGADLY